MAYRWFTPNEIIELVDSVITRDGTAAHPYFGKAHLYTGPRRDISSDILGYDHNISGNHPRAKELAPLFGAKLIDDMSIDKEVLSDVDSTGLYVYRYVIESMKGIAPRRVAESEADRIMRYASKKFIQGIYGEVTTSVCGAGRDRIFYDTELPEMGKERAALVKGLAKSKDIEIVNDGDIMDIRKLYKINAIETAYRVICINEQDKLFRTAWGMGSKELMKHHVDVEEFYMIDRKQMWKAVAKEVAGLGTAAPELIDLDKKLNDADEAKKRSPRYCGFPAERLSRKEERLLRYVVGMAARNSYKMAL